VSPRHEENLADELAESINVVAIHPRDTGRTNRRLPDEEKLSKGVSIGASSIPWRLAFLVASCVAQEAE